MLPIYGLRSIRYLNSSGEVLESTTPPPITNWIAQADFTNWARVTSSVETQFHLSQAEAAASSVEKAGYFIRAAEVVIRYSFRNISRSTGIYEWFVYNRLAPITSVVGLDDITLGDDVSFDFETTSFHTYPFFLTNGYIDLKFRVGTLPSSMEGELPYINPMGKTLVLTEFVSQFGDRDKYTSTPQQITASLQDTMEKLIPNLG